MPCESIPFELPLPWPQAAERLLRQPGACFLDSALSCDTGRESWLSFGPVKSLRCFGRRSEVTSPEGTRTSDDDPFDALQSVFEETGTTGPLEGFFGGWMGLLGFELGRFVERLPDPKPGGPGFPDLWAGFFPWVLRFDHAVQRCELRTVRGAPGAPYSLEAHATALRRLIEAPLPPQALPSVGPPRLATDRAAFEEQVRVIKRHIYEGDIYQANLTRQVSRSARIDAATLYARLRAVNPAPFAGFLDCGGGRYVLSSSPERFVRVQDGFAETRPIKGTRPRGATPEEDERLRQELLGSEKDHAELAMIVDLERNDLGRVAQAGSVEAPVLAGLHSFARVHHLEGIVRARLRPGTTPADLLRATFPGGSISGAPKVRSLEILHGIEPVPRGPYTGSLFRLGPDGDFDSNILIRTLLLEPGLVRYNVGGGIVADSDPAAEWDETLAKEAALEAVLQEFSTPRTGH